MKYSKIFSFILILFLIQSSKQFSLDDSFKFISKLVHPSGFLFQLIKLKLMDTDEDFSCTLCKRIVAAIRTTVEEKYTPDEIVHLVVLLCSLSKGYDYCENFYSNYGIPFLKNTFVRLTNSENLCHTLGLCFDGQDCEDTYDYAIRLLKDKPDKKREPIDPEAPTLRMLQMTDIHFDPLYIENASVYCDESLCCHEPASNYSRVKSGKFGSLINCDTSKNTLESFIEAAKNLNPDFIIWTGDNAEHNNWNSSQEEVYYTTQTIKDTIDNVFGKENITVYPVIGNHEVYPNDLWKPGNVEIFAKLGEIYSDFFFEEQALESFKKYGYYTELHPDTNLRIIALNCLYCDGVDYHLLSTTYEEAKAEFIWLENVLREAEKNNEYVYILDHFPINGDFMLYECAKRLRAIFDRFDYIIRGYFSGHTHKEDISPVRRYFEPRPIINMNFIAPSIGTSDGGNPSFRIYTIDSNSKNVIDYEQYRLNLTDANLKGKANWYLSHKGTELFNVTDLTQIENMTKIDVEGEYILKRYADSATEKMMHNKKEIKKAKCTITTDSFRDYYICTEQGIFNGDFFHYTISEISGEWGKTEEKDK